MDRSTQTQFLPIADLDLAKLAGRTFIKNSAVSLAAGRYAVSDLTGKIFNQNCDGISVKVSVPGIEYGFYGGYTGLLNALNVTMLDENHTVSETESSIYSKAHDYIPLVLSAEMPSAILNQSVSVQASAFFDMDATKYNRFYLSAGLKGPIAGPLFYSLTSALSSSTFKDYSLYGCLDLQAFISSFSIKLTGEYATGSQFGFTPFTTFTSYTAYNSVMYPELTGVILPGFDASFSEDGFYASLGGKLVLDFPEEEILIKGINATGSFIMVPFSDLQIGLSAVYYFNLETIGENNNLIASLNVSLSF